jgi:hypothetical protein
MPAMSEDRRHADRVLLAAHVVEHLTGVERWRAALADALDPVAAAFEGRGDDYDTTGAGDPGRQYELAAAALAWREEILSLPVLPPLDPGDPPA